MSMLTSFHEFFTSVIPLKKEAILHRKRVNCEFCFLKNLALVSHERLRSCVTLHCFETELGKFFLRMYGRESDSQDCCNSEGTRLSLVLKEVLQHSFFKKNLRSEQLSQSKLSGLFIFMFSFAHHGIIHAI